MAIKVKHMEVKGCDKPKFRANFMINLKAKQKELDIIKKNMDKLIETFKRDGFYFKYNLSVIPTYTIHP
jgi:hypothetical protein